MYKGPCIYCKDYSPKVQFTKVEHVIPQSFGKFENNPTLKCVCNGCNEHFANNLELQLARDSAEGQLRFLAGIKSADQFKNLGNKSTTIVRLEEGEFVGAYGYREYSPALGMVQVKPCKQVGFLNNYDKYDYYCGFR